MAEEKTKRLKQVATEFNIGISTVIEYLGKKGFVIENNPNSKITPEHISLLKKEFESSLLEKKEASGISIGKKHSDNVVIDTTGAQKVEKKQADEEEEIFIKNLAPEKREETVVAAEATKEVPVAKEQAPAEEPKKEEDLTSPKLQGFKVVGKIDLNPKKAKPAEKVEPKAEKKAEPKVEKKAEPKAEKKVAPVEPAKPKEEKVAPTPVAPEEVAPPTPIELVEGKAETLKGLTVLGKIDLGDINKKKTAGGKPVASSDENDKKKGKRKRKRVRIGDDDKPKPVGDATTPRPAQTGTNSNANRNGGRDKGGRDKGRPVKEETSTKEIQSNIRSTMSKMAGGKSGGGNRSKYRRDKRSDRASAEEGRLAAEQESAKTLRVTEFISASDMASLMDVSVNEVISTCLSLGMFVSINQRLDAEAMTIIADEFGYDIEFVTAEEETKIDEAPDDPESLKDRAPIVTIMGHVDHGKTSLLDYIRKTRVVAGEAGGITQHIGAYNVQTDSGKKVTFLDTPGHEAFTAMRARGAKLTDIVVIVVAADDNVMPQTKEAINHAMVAGVPIIIAITKIDKPAANPDKVKEELAKENILVEDWGGKYQCEMISSKSGQGIPELLEKILLEAELLQLKANPDRMASGSVIEAMLDKGRGYVTTVMVQSGTLNIGDIVIAGAHYGRVKAMTDHRGVKIKNAGPSIPVQLLGINGAPQAGDKFNVMETERDAREIAGKREQILREQTLRTRKHITLDEIGRRLAIGNFKELNVIVKGDVDGSVEALSDSLLKLSTEEVQVRIIHKGVGQISESDVLLAAASDAIVIGFQVRPSTPARKIAEQEQIEIRLYSIIYDAIEEVKLAMEGMLEPKVEEVIVGNIEIREVFKISKVGSIAGCMVTDGIIKRNNQIRVVRNGIVLHTGKLESLKRFKDDVSEVKTGYECGLNVAGFNDIEVGDTIESFETKEVKRNL